MISFKPLDITWHPSLNYDERFDGSDVLFLIMHYTACDFKVALSCLTDTKAVYPVSSHYLIDEHGVILQLVDESKRAWHAGVSQWQHYQGINTWSIGIEIVNSGYEPFPESQIRSLIQLSHNILKKYPIIPQFVLGHSDIAPGRKVDPGPLFPWARLAQEGIGCFPSAIHQPVDLDLKYVQSLLRKYGYPIVDSGLWDESMASAVHAFQMHYCSDQIEPKISAKIVACLESLVNLI